MKLDIYYPEKYKTVRKKCIFRNGYPDKKGF